MTAKLARAHLRRLLLAGLAVVCAWIPAGGARATELEDFEEARAAYDRHDYAGAAALFEAMVGGTLPTIQDALLIQESRKYLAAAYVFLGDRIGAERQFEALLRSYPDYPFNPAAFPAAVGEVFTRVRQRLRDAELSREQRLEADRQARRERQRDATLRLLELASEDVVTVRNDPFFAWMPFGIGQFQNGDEALGAFFLAAEAATLLGAVVTFAAWFPVSELRGPGGEGFLDPTALVGLQVANWVSAGAFGVLAIAGVIEANVRFVPSREVRREREVPPDLLENLDLSIGPGSIGLRLRF